MFHVTTTAVKVDGVTKWQNYIDRWTRAAKYLKLKLVSSIRDGGWEKNDTSDNNFNGSKIK